MKILAIETSCDETAAAVVENGTKIISSAIATSTLMHKKYGGIVPEVAAREQIKSILPVLEETIRQINKTDKVTIQQYITNEIDAIAITVGPGLIGSLLVGVETAKTLAFVTNKPLIPVNHVLAHMYANFIISRQQSAISNQQEKKQKAESRKLMAFPAISLVVSGGHTELFLMKSPKEIQWLGGTIDDAAGEAFDKTARLLGFANGGGPAIQKAASQFIIQHSSFNIHLPRPLMHDKTLNFSFSGLKTAVLREWKKCHPGLPPVTPDRKLWRAGDPGSHPKMGSGSGAGMTNQELINVFAYEVQEAIADVLVKKTLKAAEQYNATSILISGGVAANLRLREKFQEAASRKPSTINFFVPPIELCTDNAAYIASYAYFRGDPVDWHDITAAPDLSVEVTE